MQSIEEFSELSLYIDDLVRQAAELDVKIDICDNFKELQELVETTEGRAPLTPVFDWRYSNISSENGFWIKGTSSSGQLVHMQAARIDTTEGKSLADYLREQASLYLSPHIPAIAEHSTFDTCWWMLESKGKVCYHGEIWISPHDGFRGRGLARILPRIVPPIAYRKWQPDCFYGMMAPKLAERGMSAQYGYSHYHPLGIRWKLRDGNGTFYEYVAWSTPDDMVALMESYKAQTSYNPPDNQAAKRKGISI